jgi:16S rRNA (guanine1516-N2)-methyltransferase
MNVSSADQVGLFKSECYIGLRHHILEEYLAKKITLLSEDQLSTRTENFYIFFQPHNTSLHVRDGKDQFKIEVSFSEGANAHRRKFGGGRGQAIAKAVGIKSGYVPRVCDMTAGMGGDAFVLASLGCSVTMFERHPIVHALLEAGIESARQAEVDDSNQELMSVVDRMALHYGDPSSLPIDFSWPEVDVVYLDPMFPERKKKSAQVKKEMRVFHKLVGEDLDAHKLLALAKLHAIKRVVVKRPRLAPYLADEKPDLSFEGKSTRFDIYTRKAALA